VFRKAFVFALALLASVPAQADFTHFDRIYASFLNEVVLDASISQQTMALSGSRVSFNLDTQQVLLRLELVPVVKCPPNAMCAPGKPYSKVVTLPIVRKFRDACGAKVVVARKDLRPVDGALEEIEIRDNRSNTCKTLVALAPTEGHFRTAFYDRIGGREVKMHTSFKGEALERILPLYDSRMPLPRQ
jgi:hypothetical protein